MKYNETLLQHLSKSECECMKLVTESIEANDAHGTICTHRAKFITDDNYTRSGEVQSLSLMTKFVHDDNTIHFKSTNSFFVVVGIQFFLFASKPTTICRTLAKW